MQKCNPCKTPVNTESKLGLDGEPVSDPTLHRSLADALRYLTFTRPNLSYTVQQVCLYMHDPCDPHFTALKRILRYVHGTIDHGLQLHRHVTLSRSSAEAEYRGVANVVAETSRLRNLLLELHAPLSTATIIYCDN
ncbi:ribonuclease H-like domain-containing protein, partial [Tanacetum coccineum]